MISVSPTRIMRRVRTHVTRERLLAKYLEQVVGNGPRFKPGQVRFLGYDWRYADSASFLSAFRQILAEKWYAYSTETVREYPTIIDCGANIGLASLYFAISSPCAKVLAFEPDPMLFEVLTLNISHNRIDSVEPVNAAIWIDGEQEVPFSADGADGGYVDVHADSTDTVRTVCLSSYLEHPVGLLKLDIEGAEIEVIAHLSASLQNVKQVIIEYHSVLGQPQRLSELLANLEQSGFRMQINNVHGWVNPLVARPRMGRFDQLLIVYGYRPE